MRGSRWGDEQPDRPRRGRWSQAEVARLKELYGLKEDEAIAKDMGRPVASIRKMAESIFPEARRVGPWTAAEIQKLKKYLGVAEDTVLARILGRSVKDVAAQVINLGQIRNDTEWTQEELVELKRLYGTRTDESIGLIFGRTESSVAEKAQELCLAKDKAFVRKISGTPGTRMPRWAPEEIEELKTLYSDHSNLDIAQMFNRSVKSVVSKAHNLGLKKNRHRLQEMGRQNVSLRYGRQQESEQEQLKPTDDQSVLTPDDSSDGPPPPPLSGGTETS